MVNVSVFSGSKIGQRPWRPGKQVTSLAILGGAEYDFRQAQFEQGDLPMCVLALLGGVKIIVPPGLSVSLSGLSLFGGREVKVSAQKEAPAASERTLRLNAYAIFGGVEVVEKPVGQE